MKKIRCVRDKNDFIYLERSITNEDEFFIVMVSEMGDVVLDAAKIRELRKEIKRALIEIEGNDSETGNSCSYNDCAKVDEKDVWIPKRGDFVRFVYDKTLDEIDKCGWHPKNGEIYVVKHFYEANGDEFLYHGISLQETPKTKYTCLDYGYKFRLSGFEPA